MAFGLMPMYDPSENLFSLPPFYDPTELPAGYDSSCCILVQDERVDPMPEVLRNPAGPRMAAINTRGVLPDGVAAVSIDVQQERQTTTREFYAGFPSATVVGRAVERMLITGSDGRRYTVIDGKVAAIEVIGPLPIDPAYRETGSMKPSTGTLVETGQGYEFGVGYADAQDRKTSLKEQYEQARERLLFERAAAIASREFEVLARQERARVEAAAIDPDVKVLSPVVGMPIIVGKNAAYPTW